MAAEIRLATPLAAGGVARWVRLGVDVECLDRGLAGDGLEVYRTNTASVPITITGVEHTPPSWVGMYSGPMPGIPTSVTAQASSYRPFHPFAIAAGSATFLTLIYYANPKACGANMPGATNSTDSATIDFTVLGVFHDTQMVPLRQAFYMAAPTKKACAASTSQG